MRRQIFVLSFWNLRQCSLMKSWFANHLISAIYKAKWAKMLFQRFRFLKIVWNKQEQTNLNVFWFERVYELRTKAVFQILNCQKTSYLVMAIWPSYGLGPPRYPLPSNNPKLSPKTVKIPALVELISYCILLDCNEKTLRSQRKPI